ncbi:High mobility group protein DSP1 [Folsomia candida]|uniref:High mobility group protein DSP1 n=1 Tax=Folsomia candida TaxID=158441 RepID=A0A226D570_FOLCA|nr:High mobility group protein DSP1 [Folsomia candida]
MGRLWALAVPETKEKYKALAEKDKTRYLKEMEIYERNPVLPKAQYSPPKKLNHDLAESTPDKLAAQKQRPGSGPVTRAQAVKLAIKTQQKEKSRRVGKNKDTAKSSSLSDVARITRSMKNRGDNTCLEVSVESRLVNEGPIDDTVDNSFTRDPEPANENGHSRQPANISNEISNYSFHPFTLTMPSFDDDIIDLDEAMVVDFEIKDEPVYRSLIDDSLFDMNVNNVVLDDTPPPDDIEILDIDHNEDLN